MEVGRFLNVKLLSIKNSPIIMIWLLEISQISRYIEHIFLARYRLFKEFVGTE